MTDDPRPPEELSPTRYVEKVSLETGEVLDEEVLPRELLVHAHRDYHPVDVHARYMLSRVVRTTGSKRKALSELGKMRRIGLRISAALARLFGGGDPESVSKPLFGIQQKQFHFRFKRPLLEPGEIAVRTEVLKKQAAARLDTVGGAGLRVLLTGGTGFIGKEVLWQAASNPAIAEVIVLVRPKEVGGRAAGAERRVLSAGERGESLLRELHLEGEAARARFRFVAGDVEAPGLGIGEAELAELRRSVTHVVHCAASVAFDAPYEESFRANVLGTLNALGFSHGLQSAEGSPFVGHVAIETSYIHGRQVYALARESEINFPGNYYNNYYELTKAMASIETERFMLEKGLRVTQLCPSIVIGEARTGNNRGDTKVVNAPVNLFGRARDVLHRQGGTWVERSKVAMLARLACVFPGDPSAEINLIPVDRVAAGILAALERPEAVGERVHLANDSRITSEEMAAILREELGVRVKLAEPTLHRTVGLPIVTRLLGRFRQDGLARVMNKMSDVFGGYSEWGQPIHEVGNDVRLLGLSAERPDARLAFRMLCRHNRYVQEFGRVQDREEISRREKRWRAFVDELEERTGRPAGALPSSELEAAVERSLERW